MRLAVRLDRRALRQWHHEVVAALSGRSDVEVGVLWSEDRRPVPREVEQLFALEQRLHGLPRGRSTLTDVRPFMRYVDRVERPEVVLDLVAGYRGVLARGALSEHFGEEGQTQGFDVVARLGGSLDLGFAYGVEAGVTSYFHFFSGDATTTPGRVKITYSVFDLA